MTDSPAQDVALAAGVAAAFRQHVVDECCPRIRRCVELLSHDELWRRPSSTGNSVGNLLLHLAGNVRQWIVAGLGGRPDARDRDGEFAARDGAAAEELLAALEATATEALAVVERAGPDGLLAEYPFQGGRFTGTGLAGVIHVIEHFSGHAYQIYAWTKQLKDVDLRFYEL